MCLVSRSFCRNGLALPLPRQVLAFRLLLYCSARYPRCHERGLSTQGVQNHPKKQASPSGEPDVGLDPRIRPEPKAAT